MEKLTNLLEQLSEKLGTTTEYLWGVLINQAKVEIITFLVMLSILILTSIFYARYIKWLFDEETDHTGDSEITHSIIVTTLGVFNLVYFIFIVTLIPKFVSAIFNPEYWAINEILSKIH